MDFARHALQFHSSSYVLNVLSESHLFNSFPDENSLILTVFGLDPSVGISGGDACQLFEFWLFVCHVS